MELLVKNKNDKGVADLFSKHFGSVYIQPNIVENFSICPHLFYDLPSDCFFNVRDVEIGLAKLHGIKSVTRDNLSSDFLYTLRFYFIFLLSIIHSFIPKIVKIFVTYFYYLK